MRVLLLSLVILAGGCSPKPPTPGSTTPEPPPGDLVGICEHVYEEPLVRIESARHGATGAEASAVALSAVTIYGQSMTDAELLETGENLTLDGDRLVCTIPCAFGQAEGDYAFTYEAAGIGAGSFAGSLAYAEFQGGCPSFNRGSARLTLALD
jgi:hypothetical protein